MDFAAPAEPQELSYGCPYCGEQGFTLPEIDGDGVLLESELIEDCRVCCRPIRLQFHGEGDGELWVNALREDE